VPKEKGALGISIRHARKRRRLTIQQVAEISGVSISFISQVERDLVSPSVNSLQKISRALGMQIGGFFEEKDSRRQTSRVIRAHERARLIYPGRTEEEYLLTPVRSKKLQVLYYRLKPGATSGDTPYTHDSEEECGIVLRGSLEVTVASEKYILHAGDSITFESTLPHAWRNKSKEMCEAIWVVTPPGY